MVEKYELELPGRHYPTTDVNKVPSIHSSTTELAPTTNIQMPENEIVEISSPSFAPEPEKPVITTTTSTTPASTTAHHRIRGRPIKYDNSNRPRFSVKDYRQKLSQYSSTTPEPYRTTSDSLKIRLPTRLRSRPTSTTVSSTDVTTESHRSKFTPKDPRHGSTNTDNSAIITEKSVKAVNTRLRPFNRFRSTTPATTSTPKVSIRPNLFAARRRPPMLSLRNKILSKYQKNTTDDSVTKNEKINEENEVKETTPMNQEEEEDSNTTEETSTNDKLLNPEEKSDNMESEEDENMAIDILKNESYVYSQRVSDLTSSSKNEYDTPGLFKSVTNTSSRRIPSHFTISTDDPILPIEAFFPNIKDKDKA